LRWRRKIEATNFVLGVHYHSPFYREPSGDIHIVSFTGSWLDELSSYFKEIVYIGHQTEKRLNSQDYTIVNKDRIKFHSIGPIGGITTLPLKVIRTRKAVKKIEGNIDGIIVRAPTPRQGTILSAFQGKNKAIYLVGEPIRRSLISFLAKGQLKDAALELLNRRRRMQTERLAKNCVVISNSYELCKKYEKIFYKKTYYCPSSSIKEENFFSVEDRCQQEKIKLLFVGRVCRDKGMQELIEAVSLMKKKGMNVILNIAGDSGDADKIEMFKEMAEERKLEDVIVWNGRVPYGDKLFSLYRESDILILPSAHEGFPHVIYEAVASSVLVVVTRVGGISDVCHHKREVYFIEKTPESIVNAVSELISNPALRKEMIKCGQSFAKGAIAGKNEKIMTEILEKEWA
jgi:glycosyltransferase involved in cell wall biosynthesis